MDVLLNWILFTVFILGTFASDDEVCSKFFDDIDQQDKNRLVEFLSQGIQHYNSFNQNLLMDIKMKFGLNPLAIQHLYALIYSINLTNVEFEIGNYKPSHIIEVCWKKENKKWHAHWLAHNKKKYDGGYFYYFDNKVTAAMSVNLICDRYEKKRKYPDIDIQLGEHEIRAINNAFILFDLQQVTKIFKTQTTDQQKKSFLWPLFESPTLKTLILAFLIADYDSEIHVIE